MNIPFYCTLLKHICQCMAASLILSACGAKDAPISYYDPNQEQNRQIHAFNRSIFQTFVEPVENMPAPNEIDILKNITENLSLPNRAINNILQFDIIGFIHTILRFNINSIVGFGGLADVASTLNINNKKADFGQTLYKWGVGEGKYIELPFLGPGTERDIFGRIADILFDPFQYIPSGIILTELNIIRINSFFSTRVRHADIIKGIYDSEDSYATQRNYYLQNRRFFLNGGIMLDDLEDPFDDDLEFINDE